MTVERKDRTQLILCECGCGQTLLKYRLEGKKVRWSRPRKFISGHQNRPQEIKDTIAVTKRIHPQLQNQIQKAWQIVGVI